RQSFTKAWELARQTPPENPVRYDVCKRLASIRAAAGEFADAVNWLLQAISWRESILGPKDPAIPDDLLIYVNLCRRMKDYDQAEDAYRHALVIRETLYGKTHADLISTVDGLAYAIFGQKKYDAAEPIYQRLIALWEESVGKDHPMVAVALDKVAVFYAEQK